MHSSSPKRIAQQIINFSGSVQHSGTSEVFGTNITCLESMHGSQITASEWVFDWHSELCRKIGRC